MNSRGHCRRVSGIGEAGRWRQIRGCSEPCGNETSGGTWESGTSCGD